MCTLRRDLQGIQRLSEKRDWWHWTKAVLKINGELTMSCEASND